jgi:hypothetical protein
MIVECKQISDDGDIRLETVNIFDIDDSIYSNYLMFKNSPVLYDFLQHSVQQSLATHIEGPNIRQIQI